MSDIPPPKVTEDDPVRHLNCQDALHACFKDLAERAMKSGWKEGEVMAAIIDLADNHMLAAAANNNTIDLIEALKKLR